MSPPRIQPPHPLLVALSEEMKRLDGEILRGRKTINELTDNRLESERRIRALKSAAHSLLQGGF